MLVGPNPVSIALSCTTLAPPVALTVSAVAGLPKIDGVKAFDVLVIWFAPSLFAPESAIVASVTLAGRLRIRVAMAEPLVLVCSSVSYVMSVVASEPRSMLPAPALVRLCVTEAGVPLVMSSESVVV